MNKKINIVVAGDSSFSWYLVNELKNEVTGRLYFVLEDKEQAIEASLLENVIAITGDITDTDVLDQLDLAECHTVVIGSKEERANIMAALYAKNEGAQNVYARVFEEKVSNLLKSLGVTPIITASTAASFSAVNSLQPSVARIVNLTEDNFSMVEIEADQYADLIGHRLGNLHSEHLHVIAIQNNHNIFLGYNHKVEVGSKLIAIYDKQIKGKIHQEIRQIINLVSKLSKG
ncbi:MAG: NAD-binding protein [Anaerolineaceae bacterium]|nr:NAD-binding protein [Anaerolineaceae bacterium]